MAIYIVAAGNGYRSIVQEYLLGLDQKAQFENIGSTSCFWVSTALPLKSLEKLEGVDQALPSVRDPSTLKPI